MDPVIQLLKLKSRTMDATTLASLATAMATLVLLPGFAPGIEMAKQIRRFSRESSGSALGITGATLKINLRLLKIAFPSWNSRAGVELLALTLALVCRTYLSLRIASLVGELARTIVRGKAAPFAAAIARLAGWSIPASVVNASLRFLTSRLQVDFREKLTDYLHREYLHRSTFFAAVGLGQVDTVEQRVSEGVSRWADDATSIYSALLKPLIDMAVFSWKVASLGGGWSGPLAIIGYYVLTAAVLRSWSPNFARLTAAQQQVEAQFRQAHSTAIAYAEEIEMENGVAHQRAAVDDAANLANRTSMYLAIMRFRTNVMEGLLVKYGAVMVGYAVCAQSIFSQKSASLTPEGLTGVYMHSSQLLVNLARAVGMLLLSYRSVSSLSGSASRIDELERNIRGARRRTMSTADALTDDTARHIAFSGVDIVTPDGTVILPSLSFAVKAGENLLVLGPNGCGKSSTFRVLGGLWPHTRGRVTRPAYIDLSYIPQRPYLCSGTLRQQVIYPDDTLRAHVGDAEIYKCLELAHLNAVVDRLPNGLDTPLRWGDGVLSVGEMQRLALARVFYHSPMFAIMDECSSAIDVDVEAALMRACSERHITLLTIAHRRTLWSFHSHVLRFDGEGGYLFGPFQISDDTDTLSISVVSGSSAELIGKTVSVRAVPSPQTVSEGDAQ